MHDRDRFEKCLALAARGATAGERAAGRSAAERIAAAAGLTLAEATARVSGSHVRPPYPWAHPREPVVPVTVAELLRQKAETEAWRRRRTAAADRRRAEDEAARAADATAQRAMQAARDRAWAEAGAGADSSGRAEPS